MKYNTNPVRGTVDYLPNEMEVRSYAERIIIDTYKENGFLQIKTPILENLELLTGGDSGDNQKLMFKTIKRGDKLDLSKPNLTEADIAEEGLRYDLTVPLVRFFSNNREKLPFPFKAIQVDEAFRAERPQKGRVREFTQCDIDILGDSSNLAEIELLLAGASAYNKLGFKNVSFKINDRRVLNEMISLAGFNADDVIKICISLDKLDKIGEDGVSSELVDSGYPQDKVTKLLDMFKLIKGEPEGSTASGKNQDIFERLKSLKVSDDVITNLKTIISTVSARLPEGIVAVYDPTIIRGQGYYTGTVFEVYDDEFGRAIGGGGRYDKMVEKFTGSFVPAVGFSIGFYSVVMLMIERNALSFKDKLALVYDKADSYDDILNVKQNYIQKGYCVSTFAFPKNFNNFAEKLKQNGIGLIVKMSDKDKVVKL